MSELKKTKVVNISQVNFYGANPSVLEDVGLSTAIVLDDICMNKKKSLTREDGFFEYNRSKALAKKMGVSYKTVLRHIDKLVDKGYIAKKLSNEKATNFRTLMIKQLRRADGSKMPTRNGGENE